ncbi:MAG: hypothetical protein WBL64_00500, partial [Nitrososphaeraceae archaeon]
SSRLLEPVDILEIFLFISYFYLSVIRGDYLKYGHKCCIRSLALRIVIYTNGEHFIWQQIPH